MLGFRSLSEGGADTGRAKAEIMVGHDFDIGSAGVGWHKETSGNLDNKVCVGLASGSV